MSMISLSRRALARYGLEDRAIRLAHRFQQGTSPQPKRRTDPVPPAGEFPAARYIFAVGAIPRRYAGRTASVLAKAKLFAESAGATCEILTMNYSAELDDVTHEIAARGALGEGVRIINLYDALAGTSTTREPVSHPIDLPGMDWVKEPDEAVYRYYENGIYRLYQRFDYAGRLIVRDWFNENRGRTQRDEFGHDGHIRRTTYYDLHYNRPRQEVYFRADGTAFMNKWLVVNPADLTSSVERITMFDEAERPIRVLTSHNELIHEYLDAVIGSDRVFLSIESRRVDPEVAGYHRPNVKPIYVFHNPHLTSPNRLKSIRPTYQTAFNQRDTDATLVFLTESQRADAEGAFGEHQNFAVIPHPVQVPVLDPAIVRDPKLVVMLARLDQQKQVDEAIHAFAKVLKHVPDARFEIYGRGPEEKALAKLIKQLGLSHAVTLAGYTTDASAVYQRASVCLLTSKYEGFGLVVLEALAHGCPVVSYRLKYGPEDIITDGQTGYLVPMGSPSKLAQQTVRVLSDTDLRDRLSDQARASVGKFDAQAYLARWGALFRRLDAAGWI